MSAKASSTSDARLNEILDLAEKTARGELGEKDNATVSAEATLNVTGDTGEQNGVIAGIKLGKSHKPAPTPSSAS